MPVTHDPKPAPIRRRNRVPRPVVYLFLCALLILVSLLVDRIAFDHFRMQNVYGTDWGRLFRMAGYLPAWLLVSAALALIARPRVTKTNWRDTLAAPVLLLLSTVTAGLLGELVKLLVRRERPKTHLFTDSPALRPWSERPFDTSGLSFPSSHTVIAFAAAFILMRLYPRAWPVWLVLAVGCAATRVLDRAHFFSDTVAAACLSFGVAWLWWRVHESRKKSEG